MNETLPERGEASEERRVTLLTRVLSYDDLTVACATTHRVEVSPFAIGRSGDPASGVVEERRGWLGVPDAFLSSSQARLERRGRELWLVDAGSRNGSFVNGVRVAERALADGDLVELGHSLFCVRTVTESAADAAEAAPAIGAIRTRNPAMALLLRDLARIAPSRASVLVLAETGAGKESFARLVHAASDRRGALRAVDCGAIPESLFESTLFGHRRGAFTSAVEARTGEITRADGGTLFLDEVGNLSAAAQAKLLRVIEDGTVVPVGAAEGHRVDVRWVAATNRPLFDDDGFRADLLRRLAGWVARIPPLRDRREDLGELTAALLAEASVPKLACSVEAGRELFTGAFPGNVRELAQTLRSAALLARGGRVELANLPEQPSREARPEPGDAGAAEIGVDVAALSRALTATRGNVVRAARQLGTHPRQVYRWIERAGLSLDRFRA